MSVIITENSPWFSALIAICQTIWVAKPTPNETYSIIFKDYESDFLVITLVVDRVPDFRAFTMSGPGRRSLDLKYS